MGWQEIQYFISDKFSWQDIQEFINDELKRVITTAILIFGTIIILFIVRIIINRLIKRQKTKRSITLGKLIQSILQYTLIIVVIIIILSVWGLDVGPILAGAGIVGVAIGFGAQSLIKDLLSGVFIVFDNYYDINDVVEVKGFKGTVIEIGLRSTKIQNWKGEVKILANGEITEVINFTKNPSLGVVEFEIAYRENILKVMNLLEENIGEVRELFPQIIEGPNILGVTKLGQGSFSIRIIVKTKSEEHYSVERGLNKFVKELFEKNNIEIPFQRTVIYNDKISNKL